MDRGVPHTGRGLSGTGYGDFVSKMERGRAYTAGEMDALFGEGTWLSAWRQLAAGPFTMFDTKGAEPLRPGETFCEAEINKVY